MRKVCLLLLILSSAAFAVDPAAVQYLSFEDDFGIATHVDDETGVAGSIDFIEAGPVGKCSEWTNPTGQSEGDNLELPYMVGDEGTISMYLKVPEVYDYMNLWSCGDNVWWMWEAYCSANGNCTSKTSGYPAAQFYIGSDVALDTWFHYAWTWNKSTGEQNLYINGSLFTTATNTNWVEPGDIFDIGGGYGNWKFNGQMDEFYIFDRDLSADEVAELVTNSTDGKLAYDPRPYVGTIITDDETILELSWLAPEGVASPTYDVYLSSDPNFVGATPVASGLSVTNYTPTITLDTRLTYYWRVDVVDGVDTYKGVKWSFKTLFGDDSPIALQHLSFEDNFGIAKLVDDENGVAGSIDFAEAGQVGKCSQWTNPTEPSEGDNLELDCKVGEKGTISMYLNVPQVYNYMNLWSCGDVSWLWEAYVYDDGNCTSKNSGYPATQFFFGTDVALDTWFHYAWTWNKSTGVQNLYINGSLLATVTNSSEWVEPSGIFDVGGGYNNWKFNGQMDEFYIFDRDLSADEVAELTSESTYKAYDPSPFVAQDNLAMDTVLSWKAPAGVAAPLYDVYVSTDPYLPPASKVASGISATSLGNIAFTAGQKNYWRVDVVDGANVYKGVVWSFTPVYLDSDFNVDSDVDFEDFSILASNWNLDTITTPGIQFVVDDFDSYQPKPADPNVADVWERRVDFATDETGITAIDTVSFDGGQAMQLTYDFSALDGSGWAVADWKYLFDTPQDLTAYDKFVFKINCLAGNSKEDNFVFKLLKGGTTITDYVIYPSLYQLNYNTSATTNMTPGWQTITVDISDMTGLTDIYGIVVDVSTWPEGSGVPYDGQRGSGTILLDDIQFMTEQVCSGPQEADLNGDCKVNIDDLQVFVTEWLAY